MKIEKSKYHITNAIIREVSLRFDRDVFLSGWVFVAHEGGTNQGFGGYVLGGVPQGACGAHHEQPNLAAMWCVGVMLAAGVEEYHKAQGKAIRVVRENDKWGADIIGIGHIIKDDLWFMPKVQFAQTQEPAHD